MELSKAILTEQVSPPEILPQLNGIEIASEDKKKHIAKEFESLLLNRVLEQMNNTVGQWDNDQDAAIGQIRGIFNMYMAEHISDNGGFGLWKDIYKSLTQMQQELASAERSENGNNNTDSIDQQI
ncbi:MAG: hypothetical protein JW804_06535 [Sedimentisphaerales bacterium]|nr:hypothetical protein [Sedimentisphaerales bacterium]